MQNNEKDNGLRSQPSEPASKSEHLPTRQALSDTQSPADPSAGGQGSFPGLITREREPMNLEFPFPTLDGLLTPTHRFFVRSHFPIPQLDTDTWQLTMDGEVAQTLTISYEELRQLPARTVVATLECAGNGRSRLVPKAKGLLWEQGAVGTAEWTGVPLSVLLERAGAIAGAIEVILEGADQGEVIDEPRSPGVVRFVRSLPIAKARQPEVLIAYQMNGKALTREHGYPVRAIIPGWYGMASVKWLTRITLSARPYHGYWQTLEYAYWQRHGELTTLTPVTEMLVKAEIARPALHERVASGRPYRIHGAAWSGDSPVTRVDISTDGGQTYQVADLLDQSLPFAWRLWEYTWPVPPQPGRYQLIARATDARGQTQLTQHAPDRRTYMVNALAPVEVEVE
jgi:DMSO/TMAO reductase YedYZ molybdopterin-dependent catalytic subunit